MNELIIDSILKYNEIAGLLFGILYLIGALLEKRWCWYAGISATICYAFSVYYYQLYGEFILQFFYLFISFYGLYQWRKTGLKTDTNIKKKTILSVSYSSSLYLFKISILGILFTLMFYFVLLFFNSSYPFWDALTSGFGVSTTIMVAHKKIENWIYWIIIDIILCVLLYHKGLNLYSMLYFAYVFFAVFGFYKWHKEYKNKMPLKKF